MAMYRAKFLLLVVFVLFGFSKSEALVTKTYNFKITINDIKVIRIITPGLSGSISLKLFASEAGASVQTSPNSSDSHSWLQVTSISPAGVTRKIQVSITNGNIPNGTLLKLSAANCTSGEGPRGSATTTPFNLLRNTNITLISGIGSCYTGITNSSGYNLTYNFTTDPANLGAIRSFTNNIITVTYTITNE
jgi:hypothetical protein